MRRHKGGYTIVEVLIVIAVTGALFVATVIAVSGQQTKTQFNQGMRDIESRFQDILNDASVGYAPRVTGSESCSIGTGGRPAINNNPGQLGTSDACVVVGRAIQIRLNQDTMHIYTVLGCRLLNTSNACVPGNSAGARQVNSLAEARPQAAISGTDLTEDYQYRYGIRPVRAVSAPPTSPGNSHLAAFYINYNQLATGQEAGDGSIAAFQFPLADMPDRDARLQNCLRLIAPCDVTNTNQHFKQWRICFERADGKDTARLVVGESATSGGLSVRLEFEDCRGDT